MEPSSRLAWWPRVVTLGCGGELQRYLCSTKGGCGDLPKHVSRLIIAALKANLESHICHDPHLLKEATVTLHPMSATNTLRQLQKIC